MLKRKIGILFISCLFMILLLIAIICVIFVVLPTNNSSQIAGAAEEYYEHRSTEMLRDVSVDFSFGIVSKKWINNSNAADFVSITDMAGTIVQLNVKPIDDGYLVEPFVNYKEGNTYGIYLKNAEFLDKEWHNPLFFSVEKPVTETVEYNDTLKFVSADSISEVDEQNKAFQIDNPDSFSVGDVLIIPTLIPNMHEYVDVAYKIESIDGNNIEFSSPNLNEIYKEFEINNSYVAKGAKVYSEELIKNQILNSVSVSSVAKALNDMVSDGVELSNKALAPSRIDVKFKSIDPLDVDCNIVWNLTDKLKFYLTFTYESNTIVDFYGDEAMNRQTTSHHGIWTIVAGFHGDILSLPDNGLFESITVRNKYANVLHDAYEADAALSYIERQLQNPNLSSSEKAELVAKRQLAQQQLDYANLDKKYLALNDKYAAILELETLSDYYKQEMSKSDSTIDFVQLFFPVAPGVAFTVDVGAVLDFSIVGALEAKLNIESVNEVTTVTTADSQSDNANSYYKISSCVSTIGSIELKIGAQLGIGVTIAGIFNLDLSLEAGVYAEFSAIGAVFVGDINDLNLSEDENSLLSASYHKGNFAMAGSIDFDIGAYYLLDFTVSFDLWILDISKSFEIVGTRESFFNNSIEEDEVYKDLVFANDREATSLSEVLSDMRENIEKGVQYDPTRVFVIDNETGAVNIPAVYMRSCNLRTGEVSYSEVEPSQLVIVNQDDVYFEGLTCYAKEYYAAEIDNRLNIRINTNDEEEKLLYLPIRIVKEPIEVKSVSIRLRDNVTTLGLTESADVLVGIAPADATYSNYNYVIEKIVRPNGELYENQEEYAYVSNDIFYTTDKIEIGSTVYLYAIAEHNGVISNKLAIQIERIPVERIEFFEANWRNHINLGDEMELTLKIFPENATVNVLNDVPVNIEFNDDSLGMLEKIADKRYMLKAFDIADNLNKQIEIDVTVESVSKHVYFYLTSVPIEEMQINSAETGEELADVIYLHRGDTLQMRAETFPKDAAVKDLEYVIFSETPNFGAYVSVGDNGMLVISDNARWDMEISVYIRSGDKTSRAYIIKVEQRQAEEVLLISEQSYIIRNTMINISALIYPDDVEILNRQYEIINDASGVYISGNLIYASALAVAGTEVQIQVTVDGVKSNVLKLIVIDDPNEEITPSEDGSTSEAFTHNSSGDSQLVQTGFPDDIINN